MWQRRMTYFPFFFSPAFDWDCFDPRLLRFYRSLSISPDSLPLFCLLSLQCWQLPSFMVSWRKTLTGQKWFLSLSLLSPRSLLFFSIFFASVPLDLTIVKAGKDWICINGLMVRAVWYSTDIFRIQVPSFSSFGSYCTSDYVQTAHLELSSSSSLWLLQVFSSNVWLHIWYILYPVVLIIAYPNSSTRVG